MVLGCVYRVIIVTVMITLSTPATPLYTCKLRTLENLPPKQSGDAGLWLEVFQGVVLAERDRFRMETHNTQPFGSLVETPEAYLVALWRHECERVFCDKLTTNNDKSWGNDLIMKLIKVGKSQTTDHAAHAISICDHSNGDGMSWINGPLAASCLSSV